jgi:hypothetical protein
LADAACAAVTPGSHPPKPRLTLRVGVSGHRPKPDKLPPQMFSTVKQQLRGVFEAIDTALADAKQANAEFYAPDPHRVRLVSGLAEGADQFAIEVRPHGWEVDAILPFPVESYLRDFEKSAIDNETDVTLSFERALAQASTVVQLPEDPRIARNLVTAASDEKRYWMLRSQGYAKLGKFLLGQTDILVVVWDGLAEEGPGGTAAVVRDAMNAGIQVVWIATGSAPTSIIESMDDEQQPKRKQGAFNELLRCAVSTVVSVPPDIGVGHNAHAAHGRSVKERLRTFLRERWPQSSYSFTYDLFRRICHGEWGNVRFAIPAEDMQKSYLEPWTKFANDTPSAGRLDERVKGMLLPRYMWADALAVERSHWYRAAYFNAYSLTAVTVLIALLGAFTYDIFERPEAMLIYKAGLIGIELLLLSFIYRIVARGSGAYWQENWVAYRTLAEMLRSTRALAYLGVYGSIQRPGRLEPSSSAWFLWYLRATIRELGLPNAKLDENYLTQQLTTVDRHVVDDQLEYHVPNVDTVSRLHSVLEWVRDGSFFATVGLLALFLVAYLVFLFATWAHGRPMLQVIGWEPSGHAVPHTLAEAHDWIEALGWLLYRAKSYVTFFAALLPALAAAVSGIQETADFEGLSLRSAKTAQELSELKARIAEIIKQPTLDSTAAVLLSTAEVLTEDLGAWQSVYGRKHLGIP